MFGSAEQDIQLQPAQIRVHLTYQTAFVDSAGKLQMRRDVYGLDARTLAAIRGERGGAEPAVARTRGPEMVSGSGLNKPPRTAVRSEPQPAYYNNTMGYAPNTMSYAPSTTGYAAPQMPRYFYR